MATRKKKKFVLTSANYFSGERPHISNSQVTDFLRSREFFWRKYILKEIPFETTANMRIGSMTDDMLCGKPPRFQVRVLKRDDPDLYAVQQGLPSELLVTEREWNEATSHAKAIMREPCYKWYAENGAKFQFLLQGDWNGIPICGMADVLTVTKDTIYVDDFKIVSKLKIASLAKWFYNAEFMGYFRQLAAYKFIWQQMNPGDSRPVVTRHLISAKETEGLYKVLPIIIPEEFLEGPLQEFKLGVEGIASLLKTKDWNDPPVRWEDAKELPNPRTKEDDEDEEYIADDEIYYLYEDDEKTE